MAEAKERSEWNRAASIIVKLHNTHIVKASDAIKFENVHPYFIMEGIDRQTEEPTKEQLEMLQHAIEGL